MELKVKLKIRERIKIAQTQITNLLKSYFCSRGRASKLCKGPHYIDRVVYEVVHRLQS